MMKAVIYLPSSSPFSAVLDVLTPRILLRLQRSRGFIGACAMRYEVRHSRLYT